MKSREEKLIALKVLVSVQNISELSLHSKTFKNSKVLVCEKSQIDFKGLIIVTPHVKEVSWLLFQLQYIFQNNNESFIFLCESLGLHLNNKMNVKQISDVLMEEAGKLLG